MSPRPGPLAVSIPNPFGWLFGDITKEIVAAITKAINAFFGGLVKDALNPLLRLLARTLLTTPDPRSLPRLAGLWESSRQLVVALYGLVVLVAAIVVMTYESLQTRHSIKEIAPRVVVGFLAANLSLLLCGQAVVLANALSTGLVAGGADPRSAAAVLTGLVLHAVDGSGLFVVFLGLTLAVVLVALLVGYVVRVVLTVILVAGAPLALLCHALPALEGVSRWWWRAFAGVLAIQLVQSLTLVAVLTVFLSPDGFSFFGPGEGGLVTLIVTLALLYILYKIPFWVLHATRMGGGRSMIGSAVRGAIAYKTLGVLGLRRTPDTRRTGPSTEPGLSGRSGVAAAGAVVARRPATRNSAPQRRPAVAAAPRDSGPRRQPAAPAGGGTARQPGTSAARAEQRGAPRVARLATPPRAAAPGTARRVPARLSTSPTPTPASAPASGRSSVVPRSAAPAGSVARPSGPDQSGGAR